jgi:predicted glutamine amidotransferase
MCRIFAVRSKRPLAVHSAFDGLRKLAAEHKDGWGVASFLPDVAPKIEWRVETAERCPRFFEIGQQSAQSMAVHIRLASVGTVHERNNHPFVAGPWVFMHNGTLKEFDSVRGQFEAEIDPRFRAEFRGETDSERCFALFRTFLGERTESKDVVDALVRTFRTAERICDSVNSTKKRSAMNFLVTDGTRFFCTRRDRTLFATSNETFAAIASEQLALEHATWAEVPNDHLVTIDASLRLDVKPIP